MAPFSLGTLSEFKGERLQFPGPAYYILNFCFLKPILGRDKFQLLGCQQEEPQAVVFIAPYGGRGWIEKGEWVGTEKAHAGHTPGCAMGTMAETRSSPQPGVRQLPRLAALHNLDRFCLSAKKRSERHGRAQEDRLEEGSEVGNTNTGLGTEPEASGQLLEGTKGESQNVPIWQSNEQ